MRKTNALRIHFSLYFIFNAAAVFFYTIPGQSPVYQRLLALIIIFSFSFFATHLFIYTRKTSRLERQLREYCLKMEADFKTELASSQMKSQFIRHAFHEIGG